MNSRIIRIGLVVLFIAAGIAACGGGSSSNAPGGNSTGTPPDVTDVDGSGSTSVDLSRLRDELALIPLGIISADEEAGLLFMREEEKLAHDVYVALDAIWQQNVFSNIAQAELTHTAAVLLLLERYTIADPVGSNSEGVFIDASLQGLYDMLVAVGNATLIDALMVGAEIEELDIVDLDIRLATVVDNDDIVLVYESLQKGSRNHLRAFIRALEAQNITYIPKHLSQAEFDEIINSPTETGGNG